MDEPNYTHLRHRDIAHLSDFPSIYSTMRALSLVKAAYSRSHKIITLRTPYQTPKMVVATALEKMDFPMISPRHAQSLCYGR